MKNQDFVYKKISPDKNKLIDTKSGIHVTVDSHTPYYIAIEFLREEIKKHLLTTTL